MKLSMVRVLVLVVVLILTACGSATQAAPTPPATASLLVPTQAIATATLAVPTKTPAPPTATAVPPSPTPKPWLVRRGYHSATYDSRCDRVVVRGGENNYDVFGNYTLLRDTWTYDLAANSWEKMSTAQVPPAGEGPMAYDEKEGLSILFVGEISGGEVTLATKTWAYDCSRNTWTNLEAKGAPSGLIGARMVYHPKAERMILFGGLKWPIKLPVPADFKWPYVNETWAYDYRSNTWTNLQPKVSPPGQNFFAMVYDVVSDRVLAWIKPDEGGANTLWAYDYANNTWSPHPVEQPVWRHYPTAAYVPTVKKMFIFYGVTIDTETPINEMWTYDSASNTWAQLSPSTGPDPRGWATLTYSSKTDKLVMVGGGYSRIDFTAEVWIYDLQQGSWTKAGP